MSARRNANARLGIGDTVEILMDSEKSGMYALVHVRGMGRITSSARS